MLSVSRCYPAFSNCLDDEIRAYCKPRGIMLTYHIKGQQSKTQREAKSVYSCVSTTLCHDLDNKKTFANIMKGHPNVPPSYLSVKELPPSSPDELWFVKCQYGSNGRQVRCMTTSQLLNPETRLKESEIIQTAITSLDLIEGCKYTIRAYLLFYNKQVYLYNDACCIKHALPYDPSQTDHSVQVNHKGYYLPDSTIKLIPLQQHRHYHTIFGNMTSLVSSMLSRFQPYVNLTDSHSYALWGIDILVKEDLSTHLIEMNICPNLTQIPQIREELTYGMLNNMYRLILGLPPNPDSPKHWTYISGDHFHRDRPV